MSAISHDFYFFKVIGLYCCLQDFFLIWNNQQFHCDVSTLCLSHMHFQSLLSLRLKFWKIHGYYIFKSCFPYFLESHYIYLDIRYYLHIRNFKAFQMSFMYCSIFSITFCFSALIWIFSTAFVY